MTAPTECAEALSKYAKIQGKPVLASWMGGPDVAPGAKVLNDAGIPTYAYPDMACRTFNYMHQYQTNLESNYDRIDLKVDLEAVQAGKLEAQKLIGKVRESGRSLLTEAESKLLLKAYGIPVTPCELANSPAEAAKAAEEMGFPVVLKLNSTTITHKACGRLSSEGWAWCSKTDTFFFGVKGYEIILGSSLDPQLGPVLLFGTGGALVEVFQDSAVALPPLNPNLARKMLQETCSFGCTRHGGSGPGSECDINPLIASSESILSLDARVLLHDRDVETRDLPQPSIRPYPHHYVNVIDLDDASKVKLRPILPEDEGMMRSFYARASWPEGCKPATMPNEAENEVCSLDRQHLIRTCFVDFDRSIVLVAEGHEDGEKCIMGAGRISREEMSDDVTFSLQVLPSCRKKGLGSKIMKRLIELAGLEGAACIKADVFSENRRALRFLEGHGFALGATNAGKLVPAQLQISSAPLLGRRNPSKGLANDRKPTVTGINVSS
eukprot:g6127.t1